MLSSLRISVAFNLLFFSMLCFSMPAAASTSTEPEVLRPRLLRNRRQAGQCLDGTYPHNGKTCCLCPAGQWVKQHCSSTPDDVECDWCTKGSTYSSEPNSKESCEPCKSCSQENANLKEEESCTVYKNTNCTCKDGYYCPDGAGNCKICLPCDKCDSTGIKEPCSATRNAVCKEETKGLGGGATAAIVIVVLVVLAVVAGIYFKFFKPKRDSQIPSDDVKETLLPVPVEPHLADVAEIIGWKEMMAIARSSDMSTAIESAQLSHPNDSEMWTMELLRRWVEKMGRNASVELIKILRKRSKNVKADKIVAKLYGQSHV